MESDPIFQLPVVRPICKSHYFPCHPFPSTFLGVHIHSGLLPTVVPNYPYLLCFHSSVPSIDISLTIHSEPTPDSPQPSSIFVHEGMVQLTAVSLCYHADIFFVSQLSSSSRDFVELHPKICSNVVHYFSNNVKLI